MARRNRPSQAKHERERRKRERQRKKAEKAAQKRERRLGRKEADAESSDDQQSVVPAPSGEDETTPLESSFDP